MSHFTVDAAFIFQLFCHLQQLCGTAQTYGYVRLVDGDAPTLGRVEVFEDASWKPICADHWTLEEATVVCRQLSLPPATQATYWVQIQPGDAMLSEHAFVCSEGGIKHTLQQCSSETRSTCNDARRVAGVICGHWANAKQFDVRLAGGVNAYEGRVEIFFDEVWGTVCDSRTHSDPSYVHQEEFWDMKDARVVCKQLGFVGAKRAAMQLQPPPSTLPVIVTNQRCNGTEANLGDCGVDYMRRGGPFKCSRSQDVSVVCSDLKVRLVDGDEPTNGRVEILIGTSWQTICGYEWTLEHAKVVCRELGMPPATGATVGNRFRPGSTGVSENDFSCTGNEQSIFDCRQTTRDLRCTHESDAGVICGMWFHVKQFDVRLAGTLNTHEGRVEVYNGVWGTVCNSGSILDPLYSSREEYWDIKDAQVVCRQLGYLTAKRHHAVISGGLQESSLPVILTGTQCKGVEANLALCQVSYTGLHRCSHNQDVSVECDTRPRADRYDARLVQGLYPNQGYVQVLYMGQWRSICEQGWGLSSALVLCKQLGFPAVVHAVDGATAESFWGILPGNRMFLNKVECSGSETNLADCPASYASRDGCTSHDQVGVVCLSNKYPSLLPGEADETIDTMMIISLTIPLLSIVLIMVALILIYRRHKAPRRSKPSPMDIGLCEIAVFEDSIAETTDRQRQQMADSGMSKRAQRRAMRKTRRQEYKRQQLLERQRDQWSPYTNQQDRPPSYDELNSGPILQSGEVIDTVSLLPIISDPSSSSFHNQIASGTKI